MQPEVQPTTPACYSNNCSVMIGTSGYSYTEWIDAGFYPPGTKSSEMLPQYARQFQVVELNYTWYQMARADAVNRMVAKAPANFRFTAKLTRTLTHERDENWQQQLALFKQGIAPFVVNCLQFWFNFLRSLIEVLPIAATSATCLKNSKNIQLLSNFATAPGQPTLFSVNSNAVISVWSVLMSQSFPACFRLSM